MNVFCFNFSHRNALSHTKLAELVRTAAKNLNKHVAIMGDLQGPKIRIGRFKQASVELEPGATFIIDSAFDLESGDAGCVGINFDLYKDCTVGNGYGCSANKTITK